MKKPKIGVIRKKLIDMEDNLSIIDVLEEENPKMQENFYSKT